MIKKFTLTTEIQDERPIYLTGDFNAWNPMDKQFILKKLSENKYEFSGEFDLESFEYKYTKGGWENVELDKHGNISNNRFFKEDTEEVEDSVPLWRKNWAPFKDEYFPIIELISEEFFIPQLNKTRRVWILLPHDYYESLQRYPVLYLQDAQNLFNESSPYGNWEIDKKLSIAAEYGRGDIIIVAIEHGGEDRINEYIFANNEIIDKGNGKKYIRFVTDTLKYYVDANYRTKPEREFTGIGGSSLGGLISIYGGFLYPEVYSKLMIFSPSLWAVPNINFPMLKNYNSFDTKVYLYGGENEGAQMAERIHAFADRMAKWDKNHNIELSFKISIHPDGKHNEWYWSQEFPKALEWLFFDTLDDAVKFKEIRDNESANFK